MKANTPDRIWIDPASDLPKLSGHIDKDSVEYIRVDAFIDTLEVKEVDFEKVWKEYFKYSGDVAAISVKPIAKHFFGLGLKAQKGEKT